VCVAVNHGAVAEFEVAGELGWAAPVEEGSFDGFAFRVIADGAFDLVLLESGLVAPGRIARLVFPIWEFGVLSCHFLTDARVLIHSFRNSVTSCLRCRSRPT
jgi:hypothetical protein